MKILIVNSFYFPDEVGGAERSLKFLAEELVKQGNEVAILTTGKLSSECVVNGVRVFRVKVVNIASYVPALIKKPIWHLNDTTNPFMTRDVVDVLRSFRPDIVHTNNLSGFSTLIFKTIKGCGLPIVHTLRDYYLICPNTALFRGGKPCGRGRCLSCRTLSIPRMNATKYVDAVVGNSKFILDRHLELSAFPNARQRTWIYNGYSSDEPVTPRIAPPKSSLFTIGYIGRIAETKGIERLLSSYSELKIRSADYSFRLVIAGSGERDYLANLRERVKDSSVEFIGTVPQSVFFAKVDLVVVPSLWDEPLSRVIFESFFYGVPVISSSTGGSPELVIDRETGWLYDPLENDTLTEALFDAVSNRDEYHRVSTTVIKRAREFTPDRVLDQYLKVYKNAIFENV